MFESSGVQDVELTTEAGYLIKVKPARRTAIVYIGNEPEVIQTPRKQTMEQPAPFVLFIGPDFRMELPAGRLALVENRRGRLAIPYMLRSSSERKILTISCASQADQFPCQVQHYEAVRQFVAREGEGHPYRFIVVEQSVPRIDMVTLKVKNPDARILILRQEERQPRKTAAELDHERMRATDLAAAGGGRAYAANPVFNARIHLRNLNLDQVKLLLIESSMGAEEIQFVRTFLQIMIRNEQGKEELVGARPELERLDELYRLAALVIGGDVDGFEQELERGIDGKVAPDLLSLIGRKRAQAEDKEREIQFWEWEYRLQKAAGEESPGG